MDQNIDFIKSNKHGYYDILRDKNAYMLLRHEDIALHPQEYAEKIYKFIGHQTDPQLLKWLARATSERNDLSLSRIHMFSTTRNAKSVTSAWRQHISLEGARIIEETCKSSFDVLGYKGFSSEEELKNLSVPSHSDQLVLHEAYSANSQR